jgi:hypothetical protein
MIKTPGFYRQSRSWWGRWQRRGGAEKRTDAGLVLYTGPRPCCQSPVGDLEGNLRQHDAARLTQLHGISTQHALRLPAPNEQTYFCAVWIKRHV